MLIGAVILLLVLFFWVGYNVGRLIEISPTLPRQPQERQVR